MAVKQLDLRTARGPLTMEALSAKSGVNKSTISRIEAGEVTNPSNDTVTRLEEALKLRRGTLVFGQAMEQAS